MPRFVLNLHAQRQAHKREVTYEDVDFVLANFDARRAARLIQEGNLPNTSLRRFEATACASM